MKEYSVNFQKVSAGQLFPELGESNINIVRLEHVTQNKISPFVPGEDRLFKFPKSGDSGTTPLEILLAFYRYGKAADGCYVYGPTGCGKSSIVRQFCSRCGLGLMFRTGHENMEITELLGGLRIVDGNTVYQEGPLLKAIRHGMWFLLDEIDSIPPGLLMELNMILDGKNMIHPETKELIVFHQFFRFVATANTFGGGNSMDYQRRRQDKATLNRFKYKILAGYPDKETEMAILEEVAPLLSIHKDKMVGLYADLRKANDEGKFEEGVPFSTRSLVNWADLAVQFQDLGTKNPLEDAFGVTILNGIENETDRNTVRSHYKNVFNPEDCPF